MIKMLSTEELRKREDYTALIAIRKEGCPLHPNDIRCLITPKTEKYDVQYRAWLKSIYGIE